MPTPVQNLLAVLHGDGGQYLDKHGLEKACLDAIEKYYSMRNRIDLLEQVLSVAIQTLNDNLHLCDGSVCTLKELGDAVSKIAPDWIES